MAYGSEPERMTARSTRFRVPMIACMLGISREGSIGKKG